jgi:hypothetical protein
MAVISWFLANVDLASWPHVLAAQTGALTLTLASLGLLVALIYDVVVQMLVVHRSVAAFLVIAAMGLLVVGEPTFAFTATQSFSSTVRTILPLHTPGLINMFGNIMFVGLLIGVPSWQFRLKLSTNRHWSAVDNLIVSWIPRLSVGTLLLITLLYHYWHGPLAHTPLPTLTIGSLFTAVLVPPVLRPLVRCTVIEGPDGLIRRAPHEWLSTTWGEITREARTVKVVNWSDMLAGLDSTMTEFAESDTSARTRALKKNGLWAWSSAQRNAYHHRRLKPWQIGKLEAVPGWTWSDSQPNKAKRFIL